MRRVPIRLRVAAGFAVAMAIVLAGTGLFLYARLGGDLAQALDRDLRLRAVDVSALVRAPTGSLRTEAGGRLIERGESFAQVIGPHGEVLDATPPLGRRSLLDAAALGAASRRSAFLDLPAIPGLDESVRLLALPIERHGRRVVLVVGATRENRAEALRSLRTELLLAGPIALLLATGLGYLLAGAGLRAVEAMRIRAARISADQPGGRLPVAATGDELERLGTTLNAMLERLEGALERERGFVAEAGHELRTPLALLRAELDYALHYAQTEAELRDTIRTASEETDRLVQLAGALLLLASADKGRISLCREEISSFELLESVRRRFAWRAEAQGRALPQAHAPAQLILTVDRLRFEQALGNLVDNALRHGGGEVHMKAGAVGSSVEICVRDHGRGFPPDLLPRAFQRFSRGDDSGDGQGAGLGLAIVEAIARAHEGNTKALNNPDGGAQVCITVPLSGLKKDYAPGPGTRTS
jgi:two-component system OmpR family sensor kinase